MPFRRLDVLPILTLGQEFDEIFWQNIMCSGNMGRHFRDAKVVGVPCQVSGQVSGKFLCFFP